jgi:glycosyltransferase involved in cell wall biosynthesis
MTGASGYDVSIVIASYNRKEMLRRCLESLSVQTQDPATFEVVVADDGSADGSAEMAEQMSTPFALRVLRLENGGQSAAQRAAVDSCTSPLCLLLDDDVIAAPELVAEHLAGHREHPESIGIGSLRQTAPDPGDWYAHTFAGLWNDHYEELAGREARWNDCWGGNLSFPLSAVLKIGGIPTDLPAAFDFDLALRLVGAGLQPRILPRALGTHDDQKRSSRMFVDAREQGAAYVELSRKFPEAEDVLLRWSEDARPGELTVRRALLALRVPPALIAPLGRLLPTGGRRMSWQKIVKRLAMWSGARRRLSRAEWTALTRTPPRARLYRGGVAVVLLMTVTIPV